jgi:hypothetical protein
VKKRKRESATYLEGTSGGNFEYVIKLLVSIEKAINFANYQYPEGSTTKRIIADPLCARPRNMSIGSDAPTGLAFSK